MPASPSASRDSGGSAVAFRGTTGTASRCRPSPRFLSTHKHPSERPCAAVVARALGCRGVPCGDYWPLPRDRELRASLLAIDTGHTITLTRFRTNPQRIPRTTSDAPGPYDFHRGTRGGSRPREGAQSRPVSTPGRSSRASMVVRLPAMCGASDTAHLCQIGSNPPLPVSASYC